MIREINTPFAVSIESLCLLLKVFVMIGLVKYVGNHSLYIKHFCFIFILLMWILSLIPSCHREGEVGLSQNDQVGIDSVVSACPDIDSLQSCLRYFERTANELGVILAYKELEVTGKRPVLMRR